MQLVCESLYEFLNEGEQEFWNDGLDIEDKMDVYYIAKQIYDKHGKDCKAVHFELKKILKPIYNFSDNFIDWLIDKQRIEKDNPKYDRSTNKKHHHRRTI